VNKGYMVFASQRVLQPFLNTFREFPPRQQAASFTIDQALAKMSESFNTGH
jgi:arylsulfatase